MASKRAEIKLRGGTHDGETIEVWNYQMSVYIPKKITMAEHSTLRIDDTTSWRAPDEVYMRTSEGFVYGRTVHYNPEDQEKS